MIGNIIKTVAEFICYYKNRCNFVFGEHSDMSICLNSNTLDLMSLLLITQLSIT